MDVKNNNKIKRNSSISDCILTLIVVLISIVVVIICLYPFLNIAAISINDAQDAMRGGIYLWPRKISFESYKDILSRSTFMHASLVTLIRTLIGTPLAVICTTAFAYVLSRKDLVGRRFWTVLFIFTMYFGGGQVPYYMVLKNINLLDNFWVFIFPNLISVYNMILIRNYINNMPKSIFEASKIDGANDLQLFFKIVLPLAKPVVMAVALFVAIMHWNSWFDAYLYTNKQELKTMQSILVEILNQYQTSGANQTLIRGEQSITPDSIRMAATMVATIPIILAYPFIQKYFVGGMMSGAVKG